MCHVGMPCWGCAPMRPIVQYKFPVPAPAPAQAQTDNVNCKAHGTTQSSPERPSQILSSKTSSSPLFMMGNGGQRGRYQNSTCRPQATPQVNCKKGMVQRTGKTVIRGCLQLFAVVSWPIAVSLVRLLVSQLFAQTTVPSSYVWSSVHHFFCAEDSPLLTPRSRRSHANPCGGEGGTHSCGCLGSTAEAPLQTNWARVAAFGRGIRALRGHCALWEEGCPVLGLTKAAACGEETPTW